MSDISTRLKRNHSSLFFAALSIAVCLAVVLGMGLLSGCQAQPVDAPKAPVSAETLRVFPAPQGSLRFVNNKILYWKQDPREIQPGDLSFANVIARMADIGKKMDRAEIAIAPYTAQEDALLAKIDELDLEIEELTESGEDPERLETLKTERLNAGDELQRVQDLQAPLKEEAERLKDESKELVRWTNIPPTTIKLSFKPEPGSAPKPQIEIREWQVNNVGGQRNFSGDAIQGLSYQAVGGILKLTVVTAPDERYEMVLARTNYKDVPAERITFSGEFTVYREDAGGAWNATEFGILKFVTQN